MLDESDAFRKAYAAAVAERPKKRRILAEASASPAGRTVYDSSAPEFAEAIKQIPAGLAELIYNQLKLEPARLVEIADDPRGGGGADSQEYAAGGAEEAGPEYDYGAGADADADNEN